MGTVYARSWNLGIDMDIRRWLRGLAWLIAGGVTLVVLLYLVLLAINRSDESPSADVATLRKQLETPPVADADNGYVYALGMAAAADQDPVEQGGKRRAFLERLKATDRHTSGFELPGERTGHRDKRPADIAGFRDRCRDGGEACAQWLAASTDAQAAWMQSEAWLLERYRALIRRDQWRETVPANAMAPLPGYPLLLDGQHLYLIEAWQAAKAGDGASVRDHLQEDLAFWRTVLRSSSLLITKMIAVAAVDRNFTIGHLALRALPVDQQGQAIPPLWREPITREERAMYRALAGEYRWSDAAIRSVEQPTTAAGALTSDVLIDRILRPLFQPQATSNLSAASLLETARAFDVAELSQMPQVLAQRRAIEPPTLLTSLRPYNPAGHLLIDIARPAYADYGPRAAELEGVRRAALLAATLRAEGVTPADAAAAVRASPLTNPYTGAPLQWDADSASVVFTGLAEGERQRRSVPL
jgi:hypothetical protein